MNVLEEIAALASEKNIGREEYLRRSDLYDTVAELIEAATYIGFAMRDGAVFQRDHTAQRLADALAKAAP